MPDTARPNAALISKAQRFRDLSHQLVRELPTPTLIGTLARQAYVRAALRSPTPAHALSELSLDELKAEHRWARKSLIHAQGALQAMRVAHMHIQSMETENLVSAAVVVCKRHRVTLRTLRAAIWLRRLRDEPQPAA